MVTIRHYSVDGSLIDAYGGDRDMIEISAGDKIEFNLNSQDVETLRKVGNDLKIQIQEQSTVKVRNFFAQKHQNADSILTFDDTLFTATELLACFQDKGATIIKPVDVQVIQQHESEHYLKTDGTIVGLSKTAAYAGSAFLYQFVLDDEFPESVEIEVLVNDKPMPEWMTLKKISAKKYVLDGIPETASVGQNEIQIIVHYPEENSVSDERDVDRSKTISKEETDTGNFQSQPEDRLEENQMPDEHKSPSDESGSSETEPFGYFSEDD